MFGLPLHPLIVHFPIVLGVLMPTLALWVIWRVRQQTTPNRRLWSLLVVAQGVIALSAFLAAKTGEKDGEKIEDRVGEAAVENHEEQGERFALTAAGVTALGLGGFLPAPIGPALQILTGVASMGQLALLVPLGHSGATLVYGQGANSPLAQGEKGQAGGEGKAAQEDDD